VDGRVRQYPWQNLLRGPFDVLGIVTAEQDDDFLGNAAGRISPSFFIAADAQILRHSAFVPVALCVLRQGPEFHFQLLLPVDVDLFFLSIWGASWHTLFRDCAWKKRPLRGN